MFIKEKNYNVLHSIAFCLKENGFRYSDILLHLFYWVGHIGIQLAKLAGAKVFTTASSEEKLSIGKRLGADISINYREQSVGEYVKEYTDGKGFDIVFDTVGGENLDRSFQAATTYGTVVGIAARSTHDLSPVHAKAEYCGRLSQ